MSKLWSHLGVEYWLQGTRDYPFVLGDGRDVVLKRITAIFSGARNATAASSEDFVAQSLCAIYSTHYQWRSQNGSVSRPAGPGENFSMDNSIVAANLKVRGDSVAHVPIDIEMKPPLFLPGGQLNLNIVNQTAGSSADSESIDVEVHATFLFEDAP